METTAERCVALAAQEGWYRGIRRLSPLWFDRPRWPVDLASAAFRRNEPEPKGVHHAEPGHHHSRRFRPPACHAGAPVRTVREPEALRPGVGPHFAARRPAGAVIAGVLRQHPAA